jgi:CBS domain containing-hemolysin-like protein
MAKYSASAGHIDELERKLLARSARFNDLEAKDIMIPRRQMAGVPEDITLPELQKEISTHMFTRMPVYRDTIDNVVGIFNIKELLSKGICHDDNFIITEHCHTPFYAPESMSVGMLFESMRLKKIHISIIIDEYGTASGLITLEDIIERIFGLIHDEYDEETVQTIKKINEKEFEVRGRAALEELEVHVGIEFPKQITRKNNTVNGLLTYIKGDFPKERDKIVFENLTFRVEQAQGLRATKIRVSIS